MIGGEDLEQAEKRLRMAYGEAQGDPRESHEQLMRHARFDTAVDNYIAQHVDNVQEALKRCAGEAEARRVLATNIGHHLAVGSVARSIAEKNGKVILP